jgi:hypothetical protein
VLDELVPAAAISLSSTVITLSKQIMVSSRPGCGRCAALNSCALSE